MADPEDLKSSVSAMRLVFHSLYSPGRILAVFVLPEADNGARRADAQFERSLSVGRAKGCRRSYRRRCLGVETASASRTDDALALAYRGARFHSPGQKLRESAKVGWKA
jgi:hypothetical protein